MRSRRRLRWAAIPLATAVIIALAGCTQAQLHGFLPGFQEGEPAVTNHAQRISNLWVGSWVVLLVVGAVTWFLIIFAAVVYRRRRGQTGLPEQLRYNMPIEAFYTILPLILVLGFFAFTSRDQAEIQQRAETPDETIEVYAKQWGWDFNYLDEDVYYAGVQTQPESLGVPGSGLVESTVPVLVLPVDSTIEFQIRSRDVAHSFWVIDFLQKMDAYPHHTNFITLHTQREGSYAGKCAEFCGDYHAQMLFTVRVVSQDEYQDYIQSLRDQGFTGRLGEELDRTDILPMQDSPDESAETE
ncbi:cytochrome c oxidase subunit II [Naasia sp. SYSU D00948]|uniref:aa3-type cytochrome oxidase subunit II n=1 Tax=Naasia sp. SYSU D00948 TaxID=2817379 RepID=UPI001B30B85F|nr:cytochrome c oxidase subunit II [Naasia sp. SYSU D00948]